MLLSLPLLPGGYRVGADSGDPRHLLAPPLCRPRWEPLARLALEAAYEATLLVGAVLALHRGRFSDGQYSRSQRACTMVI